MNKTAGRIKSRGARATVCATQGDPGGADRGREGEPQPGSANPFARLPAAPLLVPQAHVVVGELIAIVGEERTPLVRFDGQPGTAAVRARSIVQLGSKDIGKPAVMLFEDRNPGKPIVIGMLGRDDPWPLAERPAQVRVDVDGHRLEISAGHELVLKCGKASITLTRSGSVTIRGTSVLSDATGLQRIRGATVELN